MGCVDYRNGATDRRMPFLWESCRLKKNVTVFFRFFFIDIVKPAMDGRLSE